jgi:predicted nucleotide-binding protein
MKREKRYQNIILSEVGWQLAINCAIKICPEGIRRISARTFKNEGDWGYEKIEDFISDLNPSNAALYLYFQDDSQIQVLQSYCLEWSIEHSDKATILKFEHKIEEIIRQHTTAKVEAPKKSTVVFIGHGRSADWRDLKDHLADLHKIRVEAYETGSRAGHSIRDVLEDMLDSSNLAILVHTPEDELAGGSFNSRPNVIHETGLFQGRLGFSRAIVLKKDETEEFSNLAGIQQIRYKNIRETFGDVLAWIKREEIAEQGAAANP